MFVLQASDRRPYIYPRSDKADSSGIKRGYSGIEKGASGSFLGVISTRYGVICVLINPYPERNAYFIGLTLRSGPVDQRACSGSR